ncbi:MAG: Gfo/Idh/MocA family protein, partial [Promethearchaeota archaeon]
MKKKRTAVIGAGWFGRAHIRNFNELSKLIAVCDTNKENLAHAIENFEGVNGYSNVDELIKNEDIDAASVVTPPKDIPSISKKLAAAGIDVLMEKPMGLDWRELIELKSHNVRIMPGFIELFNPVFEKLLNHLPEIGEIYTISSRRVGLYPRREWHIGVILDLSFHDLYLQQRLLKSKIIKTNCLKRCFKDDIHEDAAFIIIDYGNAIGQIESNWLTPSKFRRMYVNGESGGIIVDFLTQKMIIRKGIDLQGEHPLTESIE